LLSSPLLAAGLTVVLYPLLRRARRACGVTRRTCVCVGPTFVEAAPQPDGRVLLVQTGAVLEVGDTRTCVERYGGRVLGLEAGATVDALHYLSTGAVGFARGLNDTPKIVALLLAGSALGPHLGLALAAVFMAGGGAFHSRRVAQTMSRKITRMNPGQGLTANLVTAALVTGASRLGLPVSTTHVAVGSLFGIGVVNGRAEGRTVRAILLAWATTLPLGAALAAGAYLLLRALPAA
jgi:inorganic phosphate transporter, PiT family